MITRETKDRILQNADIVAIVSETVKLRRDGIRQKGCCPFHGEKTPSFVVYPQTNTFKCYGCGEQGNVIDFVMKRDHLDYPEAVCMAGIRARVGQMRPDIPWTESTLDPELVALVQNYRRDNRPQILSLIQKYPEKRALIFTSRDQAARWLSDL